GHAAKLVGEELLSQVERTAIELYRFASEHAAERGVIIADTKFELGLDENDRLVLGDEALTPDSSRFWPADSYEPGRGQASFDKQFVRDFCETTGWDKTPPGPELPDDVVAGTRARYVEAFERLTGITFEPYHDVLWALAALDAEAVPVWHEERELPDLDAVVLPGGFSYGDYLRCGAIARFSPATAAVCEHAEAGGLVLGICNGFQVLCEAGL